MEDILSDIISNFQNAVPAKFCGGLPVAGNDHFGVEKMNNFGILLFCWKC
jgi:hypothetical protein